MFHIPTDCCFPSSQNWPTLETLLNHEIVNSSYL